MEGCLISIGGGLSSFSLSINDTNDARALKMANELGNRLGDCKPWYSLFTRFSVATLIAICYFCWSSITVWRIVSKYGVFPKGPDGTWIILIYLLIPVCLLYFAIVTFIQKGWDWVFPQIWFSIGRQVRGFESREKIRKLILGGICGSLFLGVMGNIIAYFILK